jgi:uncharacterized hydrophobic protein (TIGR00341 family)
VSTVRQLIVQVPQGQGKRVLELAEKHNGINIAQYQGYNPQRQPIDITIVHVGNRSIQGILRDLDDMSRVYISMYPTEVVAFRPPASEAPEQVKSVELRSPIEVFLTAIQSIGEWNGFLGSVITGAVIAWVGLITNSTFLLLGSTLIAPFAGPVMSVAVSTATGDKRLLKRNVLRYLAALLLTGIVSAFMTFLFGFQTATALALEISQISIVAALLPLAAGVAGAMNLIQSERSNLIAGTASGVLVTVTLAPPAAVLGMSVAIQTWPMALRTLFILILQLVSINLAGSIIFRLNGLTADGVRYDRGKSRVFHVALVASVVALVALLSIQISTDVSLQQTSLSQQFSNDLRMVVEDNEFVHLVEVEGHFAQPSINDQFIFLATVHARRKPDVPIEPAVLEEMLQRSLEIKVAERELPIIPLIQVNVFSDDQP